GYQFDLVNDGNTFGYSSVFNYLQGKVAGLQINNSNPPVISWRGGTPTVYLDEMRTEPDMIQNIPVGDVAYIKVFRPPFAVMGDGGGAIVIYTKKGNDAASSTRKGLNSNVISGYSRIKEFYSPNYDRFDVRNEKQDIRTTLYWNPSVVTKKGNGKVTLQFYNNDITGSFRIVVEGMTKDGLLTHFEQIIE
ncbi:MAG TPA: hypothetical protein VM012_12165, partial [Flavitalea sp.]|nr:hypothetical protein [Flavitalea sp.]